MVIGATETGLRKQLQQERKLPNISCISSHSSQRTSHRSNRKVCEGPSPTGQEVALEEPLKRHSWRDTVTVSLVSLLTMGNDNQPKFDTEYDREKVPPYNGNDPCPSLVV